jgi:hypothetical protein
LQANAAPDTGDFDNHLNYIGILNNKPAHQARPAFLAVNRKTPEGWD